MEHHHENKGDCLQAANISVTLYICWCKIPSEGEFTTLENIVAKGLEPLASYHTYYTNGLSGEHHATATAVRPSSTH